MSKAKKGWIIAATALTVTGVLVIAGALAAVGFDIKKLNTVEYTTVTEKIKSDFDSIDIDVNTADIKLEHTDEKECTVTFYEPEKLRFKAEIENKTLSVSYDDSREWYEYINFDLNSPEITISLPKTEYDKIGIETTTGNIDISSLKANNIDFETTTGNIRTESVNVDGNADLETTTGNIKLKDTVISGCLHIDCTTGNIHFDRADAADIYAETTTGNIKGTLLSGKVFSADTTTGDIDLPKDGNGGKCKLETTTGNIKIEIAKTDS